MIPTNWALALFAFGGVVVFYLSRNLKNGWRKNLLIMAVMFAMVFAMGNACINNLVIAG